ncbi:MAG: hypothetical protein Q9178_006476 [Gyalolechia marmorata]
MAWQQLLQEMKTANYTALDTSQNQGWQLGFPLGSQGLEGSDDPQTRHRTDVNAGRHPEDPVSPPSYERLLSAEASPETEAVPQAESFSDDLILVEELRGLIDHLQRECESKTRKLERVSEYIEELQPWTLHINNLVYELMAKLDPPIDGRPDALGRETLPKLLHITMPGSQWNKDELAVVVYFASRGAGHEGCRQILALKTAGKTPEPRSMLAVRGKLDTVRRIPGLWNEWSGWIRPAVDAWLLDMGVENLEALIGVGNEEIAMVPLENRRSFLSAVLAPSIINNDTTDLITSITNPHESTTSAITQNLDR